MQNPDDKNYFNLVPESDLEETLKQFVQIKACVKVWTEGGRDKVEHYGLKGGLGKRTHSRDKRFF